MLRDAFVDILQKRLGSNFDDSLRQDIINEMVFVQENILEGDIFKPWFLVSEESSNSTIVGDERVLLPSDFLAVWEYGGLSRYDASLDDPYVEMIREDWDEIAECLNYSGKPTHWDIAGQYLLMRPLADDVYPLRWWYFKRAASLAGPYGDIPTNIENEWLEWASDWFLGEVGAVIAEQYLQMTESAIQKFQVQAARGRERLRLKNVDMEETQKRRVMGGNP